MTESEILQRYTVRPKLGGSWLLGDRWELLWDGKDWTQHSEELPSGGSSAATKWGAMRKARKLAHLQATRQAEHVVTQEPTTRIPYQDLRQI